MDGWLSKKKKTLATAVAKDASKGTTEEQPAKDGKKQRKRKREKKAKAEKGGGRKKQKLSIRPTGEETGKENTPPTKVFSLGASVVPIVDRLKQERQKKGAAEFQFDDEDERMAWKRSRKLSQSSLEDFCFRLILPRYDSDEGMGKQKDEKEQEKEKEKEQEKEAEEEEKEASDDEVEEEEPEKKGKEEFDVEEEDERSQVPKTRMVLLGTAFYFIFLRSLNLSFLFAIATGLSKENQQKLKAATSRLGGRYMTTFSDEVTHAITSPDTSTGAARRTIKYFNAIIAAKWIVSYDCTLPPLISFFVHLINFFPF